MYHNTNGHGNLSSYNELQPDNLSSLESKLILFSQAMELNTPTMVSNHQSRHQALECPMEHEDLPWAGDGLWRRFEVHGVGCRIILLI